MQPKTLFRMSAVALVTFAIMGCESLPQPARRPAVEDRTPPDETRGGAPGSTTGASQTETTPTVSQAGTIPDERRHGHHAHVLILHGTGMVIQGAGLVATSGLSQSPDSADWSAEHGRAMIEDGRRMIRDAWRHVESGSELYEYTQELERTANAIVQGFSNAEAMDPSDRERLGAHHTRYLLGHAVHMAAEGANFLMIGRLDMGGELGTHAYEHGREMLAASRLVLDRVFQGQDAQGQNQASMMQIANQARQLIDLLERMPDVGIRR